ncbi:MAG: carboxypeptidase-like regulatory domain-containing protein [Pseudomonadota bacterium]
MNKLWLKILGIIGAVIIALIPIYFGTIYPWPQTVEGTVHDNISNEPIGGVDVIIKEQKYTTGDDGRYFFEKAFKAGRYNISAKKTGYDVFSGVVRVNRDNVIYDITIIKSEIREDGLISGEIENPKDGDYIGQIITITGKVYGEMPKEQHLWVVAHPVGSGGYWPQVSEIIPQRKSGNWMIQATVGGSKDSGKTFEIHLINTDHSANEYYKNYLKTSAENKTYPGIPLPNGVQGLSMVRVVRK